MRYLRVLGMLGGVGGGGWCSVGGRGRLMGICELSWGRGGRGGWLTHAGVLQKSQEMPLGGCNEAREERDGRWGEWGI